MKVGAKRKEAEKKKVLLNNVNVKANHNEVLAIIGRSGSSKSTLLDALAGRIDPNSLEGSILVNGTRVMDGLKSISGYVMQVRTDSVQSLLVNFVLSLRLLSLWPAFRQLLF